MSNNNSRNLLTKILSPKNPEKVFERVKKYQNFKKRFKFIHVLINNDSKKVIYYGRKLESMVPHWSLLIPFFIIFGSVSALLPSLWLPTLRFWNFDNQISVAQEKLLQVEKEEQELIQNWSPKWKEFQQI